MNFLKKLFVSFLVVLLSGCSSTGQSSYYEKPARTISFVNEGSLNDIDGLLILLTSSDSNLLVYEKENIKECIIGNNAFSCLTEGKRALKRGEYYASALFSKGCSLKNTESCVYRAVLLKNRRIKTPEENKYYKILENIACSSPRNGSCNSLGWFSYGIGEETEARKYYQFSCVAGDYFACYNLAWLNLKENPVEGKKYLKISCMGGMPIACVDLGIRYYTGGNKELGEKFAAQSLEKVDEYCSNGDGESCDSISRWFKITGENAKAVEYAKKTESAISNANNFNAMAKIIKYRNDNPSLFTDTSIEKTGYFKEGEKYKGYYSCLQGLTHLEIVITGVEEESVKGIINYRKNEVELGSYSFVSEKTGMENIFKLVAKEWIKQPDGYVTVDSMGTKDPDTNEFYGIILSEDCGIFVTGDSKSDQIPIYKGFRDTAFKESSDFFEIDLECHSPGKSKEDMILKYFGEKGLKIYNLIDGRKNAEGIMREVGVDEDFIISIFEYLEKCRWVRLDHPGTSKTTNSCSEGNIKITECDSDQEKIQKQVCDSKGQWIDSGDCYKWEPDEYVVDCTDTECKVPAGKFWRGCNEAVDTQCSSDEKPYREIYLDAYFIDKYPVTVSEYEACVAGGGCSEPSLGGCNYGKSEKQDHPINCVTWFQAEEYCKWAGKRLPTEAEWEKAARGTDGGKYPWGNSPAVSCDYAVMDDPNAGGDGCGTGGTMPVGSKPLGVSPYGAYDMIGNVWEWVNDWYSGSYYAISPESNPQGPESGSLRVVRGGSWNYSDTGYLRASYRLYSSPGYYDYNYGFRCARTE